MPTKAFKTSSYSVKALLDEIDNHFIGLPDIQRPFVWKKSQVRDLFDSMYKGYPVGFLLFWETPYKSHAIGTGAKQNEFRRLVLDGQQRLTSLYAVVKNKEILHKDFKQEYIKIAFNPQEKIFEVQDASHTKNRNFIADISILWQEGKSSWKVANEYVKKLGDVNEEKEESIRKAIDDLASLPDTFNFMTIELTGDIPEEDAADIFVRVNSQGTSLTQADFILTLMSVYREDERTRLEEICRDSYYPLQKGAASFYNEFIELKPDQLLRVGVALGFNRARLRYVYLLLRGKDLATGKFSEANRNRQFEIFKNAQDKVLDSKHWHDFLICLRSAGYRNKKMISSNITLLFTYSLYLIGKTKHNVEEKVLRKFIAKWFFMACLTGKYITSPETKLEHDLNELVRVNNSQEFVNWLEHNLNIALLDTYWSTTLPEQLARKATSNPILNAYEAALVLLDTKVLFSNMKVADLLNSSIIKGRPMIERHHLFPKAYLREQGITNTVDTNQIANFAYVEWHDNPKISDTPPVEYFPDQLGKCEKAYSGIKEEGIAKMLKDNALPENWQKMEYGDFLKERRKLMAQVIKKGYNSLNSL